jgi:hypothetical protein
MVATVSDEQYQNGTVPRGSDVQYPSTAPPSRCPPVATAHSANLAHWTHFRAIIVEASETCQTSFDQELRA